jgi:hypothetical protein
MVYIMDQIKGRSPRAITLNPTVLGENESVQQLSEVLDHVVTLWLAMNEKIEANFLLEADNFLNLLLQEVFVFSLRNLALVELCTFLANLFGLLS